MNEGVESIGRMAFSGCSSLKKLILPASLKNLAAVAFAEDDSLLEVHCRGAVPPTCANSVFKTEEDDEVPEACTLYVPKGAKSAYENADTWKLFTKIAEEDFSGTNSVTSTAKKTEIRRYDLAGRQINAPKPGINVIVYTDGSVMKELVR